MRKFSLETTRANVLRNMTEISKPAELSGITGKLTVFRDIPHNDYYLIFLMMVDLLEYKYIGPFEKTAYVIPIEFDGLIYLVTYEKFGMRIKCSEDGDGERVYKIIKKGIIAAESYFSWRADQAATSPNLNLESKCLVLWGKYEYFKEKSNELVEKFEINKGKSDVDKDFFIDVLFQSIPGIHPAYEFLEQGRWMHEAAVDAFFAWCEHALIHIAVLMGKLTTGKDIKEFLPKDFKSKYKLVFDLSLSDDKNVCDDISSLRNELRNFIAHGSFGKKGITSFTFHSAVGTIPSKILDNKLNPEFSFGVSEEREWKNNYQRIDKFLEQLWKNDRAPAKQYLESGFPCILTFAVDGTYSKAMTSEVEMKDLLNFLGHMIDINANMDF